jgi:predicted DNA-binding transcriptional regulator YafY
VTVRSIYRDIAALQAMRVPIEGGRGIGYIMRPGFDLPPLMFSIEEMEAIVLALALLERTGDEELKQAARRVNQKIAGAMPVPLRQAMDAKALLCLGHRRANLAVGIDLALVRRAIRDEQKLILDYRDEFGRSQRSARSGRIALIYYSQTANIVAWCELRQAIRNFRSDRVEHCVYILSLGAIGGGCALTLPAVAQRPAKARCLVDKGGQFLFGQVGKIKGRRHRSLLG